MLKPHRTFAAFYILLTLLVVFGCVSATRAAAAESAFGPPIHFRGETVTLEARTADAIESRLTAISQEKSAAPAYMLVQFTHPLTSDQKAMLADNGVRLTSYLGAHAWFARVTPQHLNPAAAVTAGLTGLRDIAPAWKIHPRLADSAPEWSVVADVAGDRLVGAYVMFHRDVPLADGVALAESFGATVRDTLESVNSLVIELPEDTIPLLAEVPEVQWLEPPLPPLADLNNSNRAITQADLVQYAPYNLSGLGVNVMVYDGGVANPNHLDFSGRLSVRDGAQLSDHATHVSGTIGGDGITNPFRLYRGMAPDVSIQSYGFEWDGEGVFLYSNPGDMENDYGDAINNYGVDLANNSIGTNTALHWDCDLTGEYGITSAMIDSIVRGGVSDGTPFRIIWAGGNERQTPRCGAEFHTTAPPAGAKNHIAVGAVNSNDDSMTSFSSWGPVNDGRIRPDIVAPGCQSDLDSGVTSTSAWGSNNYTTMCGTSMACPTVTGLCALLLEDFRVQFPDLDDPRNALLKILLAHNAIDLGNTGPDYKFGYGSVRIKDTIDFMRLGFFLEDQLSQGQVQQYQVVIPAATAALKVTIAWDDPPATPNVADALINDLDLRVVGPQGEEYLPWTLNPASPADPALQTEPNRVDNVEQVYVALPATGVYTIEVSGYEIPEGPQIFALCASPNLTTVTPGDLNCDGIVTFDDIQPFVKALSGQAAYEAAYPDCEWYNADINGDGSIDFDDIFAFVGMLD